VPTQKDLILIFLRGIMLERKGNRLAVLLLTLIVSAVPAFAQFDGPPGDDSGPPPGYDDELPPGDGGGDDYCSTGIDGESVAYAVDEKCDCSSTLAKYKSCFNSKGKAARAALRKLARLLDDDSLVSDYEYTKQELIEECEALLEGDEEDPGDDEDNM
jgi:hypothetical protein